MAETRTGTVLTRAECERLAHEAVMRWAAALGLEGAWKFKTVLASPDDEEDLAGHAAAVEMNHMRRTATVKFRERIKPEWYVQFAAHEVLHVLFAPVERAIGELREPAKTLMNDAMHSAIERLACVLASKPPRSDTDEEVGKRVPWESVDG